MSLEEFEEFQCPYCGASNSLHVDLSAGRTQKFVVDCEVCCSPIVVRVSGREGMISIEVTKENE